MAEEVKKSTTKKAAPKAKKPAAKKVEKPAEEVVTAEPTKAKDESKEVKETVKAEETTPATKSAAPAVIIAILSTVIVFMIIIFGVLAATGVIKFGDNGSGSSDKDGTNLTGDNGGNDGKDTGGKTTTGPKTGDIIDNPNRRVTVKDATLASVGDLEFYLPDDFKSGGKNKDGAYTYNLVDDDGWAQVLVYAEKSNLTPEKYLTNISPYLDITDTNYKMNGTKWVQAENANSLAYATKLDGKIYAVVYNVKLDSDDTAEAMSMIPKTLYMKKVYAE